MTIVPLRLSSSSFTQIVSLESISSLSMTVTFISSQISFMSPALMKLLFERSTPLMWRLMLDSASFSSICFIVWESSQTGLMRKEFSVK